MMSLPNEWIKVKSNKKHTLYLHIVNRNNIYTLNHSIKIKELKMKINTVAITALLIGATSLLNASSVYSPGKGVICDKKAGFCTDSYGISLALTKEYLGNKAEHKWSKILSDSSFDSTSFTLSNGLSCNTKQKVCKKSKWDDNADPHWTKILFGSSAHNSGANTSEAKQLAAKDCKDYISEKFDLRKSTIHTSSITVHTREKSVHIRINSKDPLVEESGTCKIIDGDVSYKASY